MEKTGFFEETPGNRSANRLIFIIGMIWLMIAASFVIVEKLASLTELGLFFGVISAIFYGGKLIQKSQEVKPSDQPTSN